jgi:hypothetical protein
LPELRRDDFRQPNKILSTSFTNGVNQIIARRQNNNHATENVLMPNLLNTPADFLVTRTSFGTWKRYLYPSGMLYREFVSHSRVGAWPLVHIATGRNPETGKIATARGFVAIGRKAIGVVAIGQAAAGAVAIGQVAVGAVAVGQLAVGVLLGVGQLTAGIVAFGQIAFGFVAVGQIAFGSWVFGQSAHGGDLMLLLKKR